MKYYGKIGFIVTEETSPGVWNDVTIERNYYGEMNKVSRRWEKGIDLNDDITISNELTIVTDPYILENLTYIRYVSYMGIKWKISNITVEHPRLTLSLGGIYNGYTP